MDDHRIAGEQLIFRRVGDGKFAELATGARLTKLPVNGETFVTGAGRSGAGRDFQPIVGARVAKDAAAEATVMSPDEDGETGGAALTIANRAICHPLVGGLNPLQMQESIAALPQAVLFPVDIDKNGERDESKKQVM